MSIQKCCSEVNYNVLLFSFFFQSDGRNMLHSCRNLLPLFCVLNKSCSGLYFCRQLLIFLDFGVPCLCKAASLPCILPKEIELQKPLNAFLLLSQTVSPLKLHSSLRCRVAWLVSRIIAGGVSEVCWGFLFCFLGGFFTRYIELLKNFGGGNWIFQCQQFAVFTVRSRMEPLDLQGRRWWWRSFWRERKYL